MSEYTLDWLQSDLLAHVSAEEFDRWYFRFASGGALSVGCPWRLLEDDAILLSSADHEQKYGLPAPIDAAEQLSTLLRGDRIAKVHVVPTSGDIRLSFVSGRQLEVVPLSSGYEAWESWSPNGFSVIAQGGQQLSGFKR